MKVTAGSRALAGMTLYELLVESDHHDVNQLIIELEEQIGRARAQLKNYGRGRWAKGAGESWPLAEALRLRAQLEAMEHVIVLIRQRRDAT